MAIGKKQHESKELFLSFQTPKAGIVAALSTPNNSVSINEQNLFLKMTNIKKSITK